MSSFGLPVLPESAPFAAEHIRTLNSVMAETSAEQRHWLSGFLAGYHAAAALPAAAPQPGPRARIPLTILFATESGNAEAVASDLKKAAGRQGFAAKLLDMADSGPSDLAAARHLLVVASTWGEGDPPERAAEFYAALMAEEAPRLDGVRFAVLALGDSSYVNFCEVGRRIDARLEALGGERLAPRIDCDLDYEAAAADWSGRTLEELIGSATPEPQAAAAARGEIIHVDFATAPAASAHSKANPFAAEITELVNLNGSRSGKETIHLELDLAGSGLSFEPGDSLAVVSENDPEMVAAVLRAVGLGGEQTLALRLTGEFDITALSRPVMEAYAKINPAPELAELLAGDGWRGWREGRQIVDLLEAFPCSLAPEQLLGLFRKLPPRLYSVASSQKALADEAHLLLGVVRYRSHGRGRKGVASSFVAEHLRAGDRLPVYVKPNKNFRLPDDSDRPIVMIGPGTGVAPFRAFLQERQAAGAEGRSWLFFGDRSFSHDFLYQLDWQDFLKEGVLSRIDVAFSRDQPEKVYVQHRMWQRRAELYAWLEDGAHLYVCGDEKAMAKDVHRTLVEIVAEQSGCSRETAEARLAELKRERRYQRDVY